MTTDVDQDGREPASDAPPRPSRWMLGAGVLVLFAVAMLAASLAGHPSFTPPMSDGSSRPLPTPPPLTPSPQGTPLPQRDDDLLAKILVAVLILLVVGAIAAGVVIAARALLRYWGSRPLPRREGIDTDAEVLVAEAAPPEPDAPAMRRGIAAAQQTMRSRLDPGDAIIAAWVGLEETAADSGTGRGASETPAEFALRILLHRPGLDGAAQQLLRLYEGVRFGGRSATDDDRIAAMDALARIEEGWR